MSEPYIRPRKGSANNPIRIAVLISGSGSGLLALLNHQISKSCTHKTKLILSDNLNAGGLSHGKKFDIPSISVPLPEVIDSNERRVLHEKFKFYEILIESEIELIVLSGYMKILTPNFVNKLERPNNKYSSIVLPKYPGAHAHRDALIDGLAVTGCTVHLVDEGVDTGEILAQEEVPVLDGDTIETLQSRIKKIEHQLYPKVLDGFFVRRLETFFQNQVQNYLMVFTTHDIKNQIKLKFPMAKRCIETT